MEAMTVTEVCVQRIAAINILLVCAYPIYREGLRMLLEEEPGFTVVGHASNSVAALQAITDLRPHIVMVIMSGRPLMRMVQALHNLSAGGSRTRTILLTTATDPINIVPPEDLGVHEILSQDTSSQGVIDTVRRVAAGDCWLGRGPLDHLVEGIRQLRPSDKTRFGLTKRESKVIEVIVRSLQPSAN